MSICLNICVQLHIGLLKRGTLSCERSYVYYRVSQPFFTVDPQVFRHGHPSCDDLPEISFFSSVIFFPSLC